MSSYSIKANPVSFQNDYRAVSKVTGSSSMAAVKYGSDYALIAIGSGGRLFAITNNAVSDLEAPFAPTNVAAFSSSDGSSITILIGGQSQVFSTVIQARKSKNKKMIKTIMSHK